MPDPSHESRAGVKDGKDGYEDDQVDVLCFHDKEIPAVQYRTLKMTRVDVIGDVTAYMLVIIVSTCTHMIYLTLNISK